MGQASLDKFFNPKSVVVIGASNDPQKVGYALFHNLISAGTRKVYALNPSGEEIQGQKSYHQLDDIPGKIDLAIIAIRAMSVGNVVENCAYAGIKHVIVISAGFKEEGKEGAAMESDLQELACERGISLLGPNCLGVINVVNSLNATFSAGLPSAGKISFLSQSGAMGTALLDWAQMEGVGLSKFVSLGNEASLNELDFLEYFSSDNSTGALLTYFEKITDGPRFLQLVKKISAKKPIVVLRAGRSARGASAVSSHTGSLAPDDAVFSAALRQAGGIPIDSFREMLSLAKLFQLGVTRPIQKVAILTNGGGPSAVAADQVEMSHSLTLAQLSESTEKELHKVLPPMAAVGNPIDVIGDALSGRFIDALRVLRADKDVEGILGIVTPQLMTEMEKTAMAFMKSHSKPIMPIFIGGQEADRGRATLQKKNVPNFDFPIDAIRALDALANNLPKPNNAKAAGLSPSKAPLRLMSFAETQEILSKHKLSISGVLVKNLQSLTSALEHSSGPMAMKISSPDIIHKTDVGGVVLNIRTLDEAIDARERILGNLKNIKSLARVEGVVVQPMVSGQEVIVGMKRDRTFGPAMVVGLGGIFTEVMHDTSLRVAPITPQEAVQMLSETKGFAVLQGVRGGKKVNIAALADIISKLSRLALEHPEIQEIDLNPVIVSEKGAVIADARFLANK